jgi:hypothetical protein
MADMMPCPNCGESRPADLALPCPACGLYAPAGGYHMDGSRFVGFVGGARVTFDTTTGTYSWTSPDGGDGSQASAPTRAEVAGPTVSPVPDVPGLTTCIHCGEERVADPGPACEHCGMFNAPDAYVHLDGGVWAGPSGVRFDDVTGTYSWPLSDGSWHSPQEAPTPDELLQMDIQRTISQVEAPSRNDLGWAAKGGPSAAGPASETARALGLLADEPDVASTWRMLETKNAGAGDDKVQYVLFQERAPEGYHIKKVVWTPTGYEWVDPAGRDHTTTELPDPSLVWDERLPIDRKWRSPAGSTETAPPAPPPALFPSDDRAQNERHEREALQDTIHGIIQSIGEPPAPPPPSDMPLGATNPESLTLIGMEGDGPGLPPVGDHIVADPIVEADAHPLPAPSAGDTTMDGYHQLLEADVPAQVVGGEWIPVPNDPHPDALFEHEAARTPLPTVPPAGGPTRIVFWVGGVVAAAAILIALVFGGILGRPSTSPNPAGASGAAAGPSGTAGGPAPSEPPAGSVPVASGPWGGTIALTSGPTPMTGPVQLTVVEYGAADSGSSEHVYVEGTFNGMPVKMRIEQAAVDFSVTYQGTIVGWSAPARVVYPGAPPATIAYAFGPSGVKGTATIGPDDTNTLMVLFGTRDPNDLDRLFKTPIVLAIDLAPRK